MLLQITAPHFCAGVEVGGWAALIIRYMQNWDLRKIEEYCRHKGWRCERVPAAQF